MSLPQSIHPNRRSSIAKLTRPILSPSPLRSPPGHHSPPGRHATPGRQSPHVALFQNLFQNSFLNNDAVSLMSKNDDSSNDTAADTDTNQKTSDTKLNEVVVQRHLRPNTDHMLACEGADMIRDIYKFTDDRPPPKRARSCSLVETDSSRRGSFASTLNVPGGFRRQYVLENSARIKPSMITRNFVEFLSIYGHFAGEELEDEDAVACHYSSTQLPDREETPLLNTWQKNPRGTATDSKAYFLLLKAFVGTGVLFLPKAFSNGGLFFSSLTLFGFGLLSYWCYLILVYSKIATRVSSFADIGRICYGPWLQRLILSSIIISQLGFVGTYIVFTAENLRAFVVAVSRFKTSDLDIFWFILFQALVLAPLSLIRDITKLSLLALLANGFIMIGLVTIVCYTTKELVSNSLVAGEGIYYWFNKSEFPLFIGVSIFAFEGIGLIIPIQESMIYPGHFPKVLLQVILTISAIFVFIGGLGYYTFGSQIETVILLNLPQKSPMVTMIQILYALAILLSTPIQIFPAVRLIELKIFSARASGKASASVKWVKNVVRLSFVFSTSLIALYGGKDLDRFVSFVGCFACIPLVYIYPPMLHLKSCCDYKGSTADRGRKLTMAVLNMILVLIGIVAFIYTTYQIFA